MTELGEARQALRGRGLRMYEAIGAGGRVLLQMFARDEETARVRVRAGLNQVRTRAWEKNGERLEVRE